MAGVLTRTSETHTENAVPVRVGEISTRVQEIRLRFCAWETAFQPKPEVRVVAYAARRRRRGGGVRACVRASRGGVLAVGI
jgi:ABC-type antimicrobial peptide transport system ATPase subunit